MQDTNISPTTNACLASLNTLHREPVHLTAPSAAHLTTCISPASQLRGLSVESLIAFTPASTVYVSYFSFFIFSVKAENKILLKNSNFYFNLAIFYRY